MGTSKSYGGPADRLLPSLPAGGDGPGDGPPPGPEGEPGDKGPEAPNGDPPSDRPTPPDNPAPQPMRPPVVRPWATAKGSLGRTVRANDRPRDYRSTARDYVRARGGPRRAAESATAGRSATSRFAGFLSSFSSGGAAAAARVLGLASLAGQSVDAVLAAVTNALAPEGATLEEAAARSAIAGTLAELYDKWGVEVGGLERLQAMTPDDIRAAVTESVAAYIFVRWSLELGLAIERKAVSAHDAAVMEGEMRQYIRNTLRLDLSTTDVLSVDWNGDAGGRIIAKVFQDAYALIETPI